jgi:hypothetical protein
LLLFSGFGLCAAVRPSLARRGSDESQPQGTRGRRTRRRSQAPWRFGYRSWTQSRRTPAEIEL